MMFSEDVANFLTGHLGVGPYVVLAGSLFLFGPVFMMTLAYLLANKRRGTHAGLLLGFAVAAWSSLCWLVVPYCGAYPNIPGLVAAAFIFGPGSTLAHELLVHAANFVLWPAAGWLLFRIRHRAV